MTEVASIIPVVYLSRLLNKLASMDPSVIITDSFPNPLIPEDA